MVIASSGQNSTQALHPVQAVKSTSSLFRPSCLTRLIAPVGQTAAQHRQTEQCSAISGECKRSVATPQVPSNVVIVAASRRCSDPAGERAPGTLSPTPNAAS